MLSSFSKSQTTYYRNDPKFSDTQKICCNHFKVWTMWLYHRVMSSNDADGMANSADSSRSSLIWVCTVCPAYLSKNLGSLRYAQNKCSIFPVSIVTILVLFPAKSLKVFLYPVYTSSFSFFSWSFFYCTVKDCTGKWSCIGHFINSFFGVSGYIYGIFDPLLL